MGEGRQRGQGCFPSGFKVADGGLHGQEWAGGAGVGAGRRAGKGLFGAPEPHALQSRQWEGWSASPAPTAAPASSGLRAGTPCPHPECPLLPRGAPAASERFPASLPAVPPAAPCPALAPKMPGVPSQSDLPQRSLRGSASPASFSPNRVPPRPRAAAEVTYQTPPPAPFAPDRRRDRRAAPRASGRGGRAVGLRAGGGDGVRGAAPAPPAAPGAVAPTRAHARTFPEPRDVTGRQPILVGPRRPPGAGHPTRTRGGHRRGVGDPSYARPSLEPAGSSPLGHCGDTAHAESAA